MTAAYARRWGATAAALVVAFVAIFAAGTASAQRKYKVRVDSAPQGATVYIDKKEAGAVGITPWEGSLTNGNHTVILELEGYQPATKAIKVARTRKLQEVFVPLVKKADPPRIDVRADADQNVFGATVLLDGQPQGQAPVLLTTTPGRHLVQLQKDGFLPYETWIEVKENEKVTVAPFLKAAAKPGTIVVEADVPDAEVLLDGNPAGRTPLVIPDVVEGLHVIEVRKEPALPWKQTVQVLAGQQAKVRAELQATIGGQGGSIRVLSNVQGAHVFLDGTDMGEVPIDIKDVKSGEHVIEVRAPGYQTREERITVNAGSSTVLKLDLNKEAKSEAIIKVISPVPGADVYIDGGPVGKAPVEQEVAAGNHLVRVELPGYTTFETTLRIEAGQTQTVSADLRAAGSLTILSEPRDATVYVNGIDVGRTPLELEEVEVGTKVVRIELEGYNAVEKTLEVIGGKAEVMSFELTVEGKSDDELLAEQRGLSSFGARTLPRGRSTIDIGLGYPYFVETRVSVGAGQAGDFGFDAGVGARSFGTRSELGLGVRFMMLDADPFTAGVFGDLWWGSKLFDESGQNGLTVNAGGLASLTALSHVTVTGRLYLSMWSDRHCPELLAGNVFEAGAEEDAITACKEYRDTVVVGGSSNALTDEMESLTGAEGVDMFGREGGIRLMLSVVAEIAIQQRWSLWFMLEGAPGQSERALFTDPFSGPMLRSDYGTYGRMGATYKF